jgi:allantoinase
MLEVFDQFKVPGVLAVNGSCFDSYPQVVQAAKDRNWEFLGHGFIQKNMQKVENEAEAIRLTFEAIRKFNGKPPRGWLGPGLTETWETPDLLQEAGFDYVCDWVLDDQPVELKTRSGKTIANIPYTQECNDVAMILVQHHSAREYYDRAMDQFDQLYEDSRESARVMALVIHPYIMGVPHRLKWFRKVFERISARKDVLFWTGEQILDWHREQVRASSKK